MWLNDKYYFPTSQKKVNKKNLVKDFYKVLQKEPLWGGVNVINLLRSNNY